MKRLFYLCSALVLVTSFGFTGGRGFAARQEAPMMSVRLCVSSPFGVAALTALSMGIYRGAQLATMQWRSRFRPLHLNLLPPLRKDDARSDAVTYGTDQERNNALQCIADHSVLGYIGTLNSGAALVSEPILNRGAMVMVSPANTNPVLTSPKQRAAQEPATYNHRLQYVTYYRTVTTDNLQGPAGAAFMKTSLGAKTYYLVDDKQTYGAGLAAAADHYAQSKLGLRRLGIGHVDPTDSSSIASSSDAVADQVVSAHPNAVYYGGDSETGIALARDLRKKGFTGPLLGGDAIFNADWIKRTGKGSVANYATSVGPDPLKASANFRSAYARAFHTAIGPYDATSYDAANIVLQAIFRAAQTHKLTGGIFNMRKAVLAYVATAHHMGATGLTTFDRNGDTTNRIISIYAVRGTDWKFVAQAPPVAGILPTSF